MMEDSKFEFPEVTWDNSALFPEDTWFRIDDWPDVMLVKSTGSALERAPVGLDSSDVGFDAVDTAVVNGAVKVFDKVFPPVVEDV